MIFQISKKQLSSSSSSISKSKEVIFSSTPTVLSLFLVLLLFAAAAERESHFSLINTAWAKSGHHTQVAPFANSLPAHKLCVSCTSDKNIIRGKGLIVSRRSSDSSSNEDRKEKANESRYDEDQLEEKELEEEARERTTVVTTMNEVF